MSPENRVLNGVRLTEADVQAVLQRAAQYEESISVDELSSVAAEAGISQAAVVKAVLDVLGEREVVAMPAAGQVSASSSADVHEDRGSLGSVLYGGLLGFGAGLLVSGQEGVAIMTTIVLLVGCGFRAFDNRRGGSHRKFQLEMASVAVGFATAIAGGLGLDGDAAAVICSFWAGVSIVGSTIISTAPARTIGRFIGARFGRFTRRDELPSDRRGLRARPDLQSQVVI